MQHVTDPTTARPDAYASATPAAASPSAVFGSRAHA